MIVNIEYLMRLTGSLRAGSITTVLAWIFLPFFSMVPLLDHFWTIFGACWIRCKKRQIDLITLFIFTGRRSLETLQGLEKSPFPSKEPSFSEKTRCQDTDGVYKAWYWEEGSASWPHALCEGSLQQTVRGLTHSTSRNSNLGQHESFKHKQRKVANKECF